MSVACALSILVARTDVAFMMHTIPHLVKACRFPFTRKMLVVDTAPLGPAYRTRYGIGTLEELRSHCEKLIANGSMDCALDIEYSDTSRELLYSKHFSQSLDHTHNYRGYPILGSIFAIEKSDSDYVVHFDSDMLLYQHQKFDWIADGIELLCKHEEILAVLPRSGPPPYAGTLKQQKQIGEPYEHDPRGLYRFKTFTSRVFLINRKRFDSLLPLAAPSTATDDNSLPPWEEMISEKLLKTRFVRVDLDSAFAWTLHPDDHGWAFVKSLPDIIQKIESGWYPPAQGGYYDLELGHW